MIRRVIALAGALLVGLVPGMGRAQEKPAELRIGISTFLSGPASVFGQPAKQAAEMIADDINAKGGILGVPVKLTFMDEGAGSDALVTQYRRLAEEEKVNVFFAALSSGNCLKLAPLAEDLKVLNIIWDCGTERIFEDRGYHYVFRTNGNATPEVLAPLLYLLKMKPDFKTLAVVNQDYAWGRDSWAIASAILKQLRPDVQVVAELFPKFGAPDYSTEISRLLAAHPDVVLSTSWGGDLDTFVRQAAQRGLMKTSTFVLPLAESSLPRLAKEMPEGVIIGARGDAYFLQPELYNDPKFKGYVDAFRQKTNTYPIYSVFHMANAFAALRAGFEKAAAANGGKWPSVEQVADALVGLRFQGEGRPILIREDHQGAQDQIIGVTRRVAEYPFPIMDQMEIFPAARIMPPPGQKSDAWLKTLPADIINIPVDKFSYKP